MRISTLTLIASAVAAMTLAAAPAAHAEPTTLAQLCDAQTWPRPIPDVIGLMYEPYSKRIPAGASGGALACFDDLRGITQDGRDARTAPTAGFDTIAAISPPPGTLVDRDEPIQLHLAPTNYDAPNRFAPCDWVSSAEVADIFGFTGPAETDGYVPPGSVEPQCVYRDPGRTAVTSTLYVDGAFAVDAAADYSLSRGESATAISGLGLAARCATGLHGSQGSRYNEVVVLLDDNRLFQAQGLGGQPCDQLTQFATAAVDRLDSPPPCTDGQVRVTHGGEQAAFGHREVVLVFSLVTGAQQCSLTGYPGVDSGAGGPLIHAGRTLSGFMGGLRDTDIPPTIVVTADSPASAVVEGVAADKTDPEHKCPTYTELLVTAPDTTSTFMIPVDIDTCELQVHPVDGPRS